VYFSLREGEKERRFTSRTTARSLLLFDTGFFLSLIILIVAATQGPEIAIQMRNKRATDASLRRRLCLHRVLLVICLRRPGLSWRPKAFAS
jgi:hypothetical protein